MFHPEYAVTRTDGVEVIKLKKLPAFFEGKFRIERTAEFTDDAEEQRVLLSLLMMTLLERSRG